MRWFRWSFNDLKARTVGAVARRARLQPAGAWGFMSRLAANRSGASAVLIGVCMTSMMGFAGMAVDVGLWYADKRAAQGAADAAAYSAAVDYKANASVTDATSVADAVTHAYGLTNGSGGVTVTVNVPPTSGTHTSTAGAVEVIISKTEGLFFSSFMINSASIGARAVAVAGSTGSGAGGNCVLADGTGTGTLFNASNGITINAQSCGVQVDGSGSSAMSVIGGATINAKNVSVVGNITMNNGGAINVTGSKTTGAASVADPYAGTAVPSTSTCDHTNAAYNGGGQTYNITPGVYCGGLSVSNGVTVNMAPGVYVIAGGVFSLQSGVTNAAGGVTIILTTQTPGSGYATLNIANGMTFTLTAPSSGTYAGLAIYTDPNAANTGTSTFAGGATTLVTGAMDFGPQTVNFSNGTSNGSSCTQLIAGSIVFTGGVNFNANCTGVGTKTIGGTVATNTALVE